MTTASGGLWMLLVLGGLTVATGLPIWALLIGVASASALVGVAAGAFDAAVLQAAGSRLLNLLDHDLLQAIPLYVFVGLLLQRLPLAAALYDGAARLLHRTGAGRPMGALAVGALVAPMNGSVASSSALLARLVAPRLAGEQPARALALIAASATVGVVVPPSLVLILLGDAMLRAHTEATNLAPQALAGQRVINTQDVLHAALLPALFVLLLWAAVTAWQARAARTAPPPTAPLTRRAGAYAALTAMGIVLLLAGVFLGLLLAVEAAAFAGVVLVTLALVTRALTAREWDALLAETLALSGALFGLLVGATTFSLVFRLWGTDRWLAEAILGSPWPLLVIAAAVLAGVAACALVLDAFEMIFVVIPVVAPLLVVRLADAQQVAVLLLLVLQASFLVPPIGYAIVMARSQAGLAAVRTRELLRAVAPYLAAQFVVMVVVFAWPAVVHLLDAPAATAADGVPAGESEADLMRRMQEMAPQPAEDASPAASAPR